MSSFTPYTMPTGAIISPMTIVAAVLSFCFPVSAEEHGVAVTKNFMMPARDGVRLATDIYVPAKDEDALPGPYPTIVVRTPYNKDGLDEFARGYAQRGYAVATQDIRGRYQSEGEFYIYINEGQDGYDAVEWAAKQPWCNGKIGTWGRSYSAATQNALAVERPPHLKTMFILVGTSNYVEDGAGRGGAFALLHNMAYCLGLARAGKEANQDPVVAKALGNAFDQLPQWLWAHPWKRQSPLRWAPSYQRWYRDWREHATYDDYWRQNGYNFEEYHDQYPEIPIYYVGGWFDLFKRGTLKNFAGLTQKNPQTRLLVGPWTHGVGGTFAGNVDFGDDAKISMSDLAVRWFDQHLKGIDTGILTEPRVKYFVMGGGSVTRNEPSRLQSGGQWKSSDEWPPSGHAEFRFYLHGDGSLRNEMAVAPAKSAPPTRFQFDPKNPVPTIGGNIDSGGHLVPAGPQNQVPPENYFASHGTLPLSARHDVLTFETRTLDQDIEIAGPVSVHLWVSSEATDTDFTAKLIDVYPSSSDYPGGYAMNLEDGILRMRFRDSREQQQLMEPGTVYEATIDLWATANRFQQGHRIRLDISSSNFPMYDVNPNTGEPVGRHTHTVSTINTVYHDSQRPSYLALPVRDGNGPAP